MKVKTLVRLRDVTPNASRLLAACALKLIARRRLDAFRDFEPYILKSVHGPGCDPMRPAARPFHRL
jgi:hypothetical protein